MFVRQSSFVVVLKRKSSFAGPEDIGCYISSWREYFGYAEGCLFGFWKYGDEFFISFVRFVVNFSFSYICQIIFLGESIFVKLLLVSTLEQRDVLFRFAANGSGINIQMLRRIADLSNY